MIRNGERIFLIGWTDHSEVVYLHLRKEVQDATEARPRLSTDHKPILSPIIRLSFTFSLTSPYWVHRKNHRRAIQQASSCGAGTEWSLGAVTRPAEGFSLNDVSELKSLAEEWHLNDMRAGCDHMKPAPCGSTGWGFRIGALDQPEPVKRWDGSYTEPTLAYFIVNRALECPVSGYKFGTAWLARVVPESVLDRIAALLDGKDLEA